MSHPSLSPSDAELRAHVVRTLEAQYEVGPEIGRGGMGIVYRGRDLRLKRDVAIKVLPPELAFRSEIRSRFLREAEMAAQLSHPHIVPIYSVDEREGLVYFVMALVEGGSLATRVAAQGAMAPAEVRRILEEVGDALAYAHARNTVHRDIKPDNILLDAASGRAMVTDFGIARAVTEGADQKLTATGIAMGTPAFMSPEQSAGDRELDGRADLYSLGVVAYQMLCGDLPFTATSAPALLVKHLSEAPTPIEHRADVPADLARAVMRCLAKHPDDRFPDAASFVQALRTGVVPALPPQAATAYPTAATPTVTAGRPAPTAADTPTGDGPTPDELARWNARGVVKFRKSLAPWLACFAAFIVVNLAGGPNLLFVSAFWGIGIATGYARLWADGYDWRDVFRHPRDTMFVDVVSETIEEIGSIGDATKRAQVRERARRARLRRGDATGAGGVPVARGAAVVLPAGPLAAAVRQAHLDRDEALRLYDDLSREDRARLPEVPASVTRLAEAVATLARQVAAADRDLAGRDVAAITREIDALEAAANPLDVAASETRARRLAQLKRERHGAAGASDERARRAARLESACLALRNMRFDLLRLKTGAHGWQQVTTIAEQAMALAREVDAQVHAGDEMARLARRPTARD